MQIISDNINYNNSYKSLYIPDPKLHKKIWDNASNKQKTMLKELWFREKDNPVNAIFYSEYGFLRARLLCTKFIVNFKEFYKQIPIFESKYTFINRVADVIKSYNERLKKAQSLENGINQS